MSLRIFIVLFASLLLSTPGPALGAPDLEASLQSQALPNDLEVSLEDMHPLYGGVRFHLRTDGTIEHTWKGRGDQPEVVQEVLTTEADRQTLVALLLEIQAWDQQVEESTPLPGQIKTQLTLTTSGDDATIWEWHHEMEEAQRIIQIKRWFEDRTAQTGAAP